MGMVVVIADEPEGDEHLRHPVAVAPVDAATGEETENPPLGFLEDQRWAPEAAPEGPVAVVMSGADRRVLVFRNGIEIGRAKVHLRDPERPLGTHAFVRLDPSSTTGPAPPPRGGASACPVDHRDRPGRVARGPLVSTEAAWAGGAFGRTP
jgi:hypothetical protein